MGKPTREPLPAFVDPMLATLGTLPLAGSDDDWVYEKKWDGIRAIVRWDGSDLTLTSRNELDLTGRFPELVALGEQVGDTQLMLDGEVVVLERDGRSSFSKLQQSRQTGEHAAVLEVFDVLHLDGLATLSLPWTDRRALLEGLALDGPHWRTPAAVEGTAAEAFEASKDEKLEGIVAKRRSSTYRAGRRSPDWIKLKNIRTQEVVVGGWRPGTGNRAGTIGSLLLGLPGTDGLHYIGRVGTGFTQATLSDLESRFRSRARKSTPFVNIPHLDARDAQWVRPDLVGEVAFSEWTPDERLRHPAWRGLRPDKTPGQVVRES